MGEQDSILDNIDEKAEELAIAEAQAEIEADEGVPHEVVRKWLRKLANGEDEPPPCK